MPTRITRDELLDPQAIPQILAELRKLKEAMVTIKSELRSEAKTLYDAWGQPVKITGESLQGFDTAKRKVSELYKESKRLTVAEKELEKAERQLQVAQARNNQEYAKKIVQVQKAKEAARQLVSEEQKLQGVYKKTGGLFGGLIRQIKSLALAYIGLSGAIGLVRNIFTITKDLSALSLSYKTIIKDTQQLSEANAFVSKVTEDYGLNLHETSKAYIKFRASAVATGLEITKTNKIFDSFAKTGAVMGRSAEDMNLIFLALEQMLSKGRVSAEELRRQLGEKVPGAVSIMAKSIGVTTLELDKMLRAGTVISKDVLPAFAAEMERTFGIENINRVDNLVASTNRLKTAWIEFVESIKSSDIFEKALKNLTSVLKDLSWTISGSAVQGAQAKLIEIKEALTEIGKAGNSEEIKEAIIDNIQKATVIQRHFAVKIQETEKQLKSFGLGPNKRAELVSDLKIYQSLNLEYRELIKLLEDINKDPNKIKEFLSVADPGEVKKISGYIQEIEERIKDLDEVIKSSRDERELFNAEKEVDNLKSIMKYYKDMVYDSSDIKDVQKRYDDIVASLKSARVLGWSPERTEGMLKEKEAVTNLLNVLTERKVLDYILNENKKDELGLIKQIIEENKEYEKIQDGVNDAANESIQNFTDTLQNFGLLRQQEYENQLEILEQLYKEGYMSEAYYLSKRASLWAEYNEKAVEAFDDLQNSLSALLSNITQAEINAAEAEIETYENRIDELKDLLDEEKKLKDEGRANDYDRMVAQIAEQQRLRDQANNDLERAQKRQAAIQLAAQTSDILTSAANIIADLTEKQGWIGAIVGIASAAALLAEWQAYKNEVNSIQKYAEGTEDVQGPGTEKSDSIHARLSVHERVVDADTNKKLEGFPNKLLPEAVSLWRLNFQDLTKYDYQKYNGINELIKEYRTQTEYSKKIIEAIQDNPQAVPLENNDKQIVVMMISKKGHKIDLRTISKR